MKNVKGYFITAFVFYAITLFFALHLGYAIEQLNAGLNDFDLVIGMASRNIAENKLIFAGSIFNGKRATFAFFAYTICFIVFIFNNYYNAKKYNKKGVEHGSARWGKLSEVRHFSDRGSQKNIILSKNIRMSIDGRKTKRNNNIVVFGGSGTGKTRSFIMPNILQGHSSFVITDPKGSLTKSIAGKLKEDGYDVKVLNLIDMQYSDNYNPFKYLGKDEEVFILIDNLIDNTDGKATSSSDPFWHKSEKALLTCIIYYIYDKGTAREKNFNQVLQYIHEFGVEGSGFSKKLAALAGQEPFHVSVSNYKTVMMASETTLKSILISAGVRLALTILKPIQDLLSTDTLGLDTIGDKKTALFVIVPDTSGSFNFIISMVYTQLFQKLIEKADKSEGGGLAVPVRFLLDEFPNCGRIPNFDNLVSTIRSRGISVSIILQNLAQLKNMYEKTWETIIGNADTIIFLGGKEQGLLKYLSEQFGKETVYTRSRGASKSKNRTFSVNESIISRSLITIDELETMDNNRCIVSIRGCRPIVDAKYNLKKHKGYKSTGEYSPDNIYFVSSEKKAQEYKFTNTVAKNAILGGKAVPDIELGSVSVGSDSVLVDIIDGEAVEVTEGEYADSVLKGVSGKKNKRYP
ncbi:MAG: type IV secretory system conjugative DNA transfer family protein [Clostridiales bacterium]|jgi:type IV secretion system protein VirD4|nr:type IV secretory system conjugative DNA transfer family protein [Clostridiales bacterium]